MTESVQPDGAAASARAACTRRHMRIGWWSVLAFLSLGIFLETLHGLKVGWYLEASSETRRLMFTLAHAHGVLLGILHVAFAATAALRPAWPRRSRDFASRCLVAAGLLIPLGFFLGGVITHAGDPGLGVLLVPPGALLLFVAVLLVARGVAVVEPE